MLYLKYAKTRAVVYIVGCIFHVCCWFGARLGCEDEQSFAVRVTAARCWLRVSAVPKSTGLLIINQLLWRCVQKPGELPPLSSFSGNNLWEFSEASSFVGVGLNSFYCLRGWFLVSVPSF